jgi:probable F420-dependent oxidoreductase
VPIDLAVPVPNISQPVGREAIREVARMGEAIGLHSLWLGDHIVWPTRADEQRPGESLADAKYGGELFEPLVTAGYLAGVTTSVRLGIGILVVPYRNPVVAAKMVSTLDQLSEGRVILGVGGGYVAGEFRALGLRHEQVGAQVEDLVGFLRAVEASDEPEFHGRLLSFEDARFRPGPLQRPLPIWIGGMSEVALRRAVRIGDGWHAAGIGYDELAPLARRLRELADEAGRDVRSIAVSNRLRVRFAKRPVPYAPPRAGTYRDLPSHIEGPPAHIVEELLRFEELGVSHLVLDLHEGDPLPELLAALDRLGNEVVPLVQASRA